MANDVSLSCALSRLFLVLVALGGASCGGSTLPPDDPAVLDANDTGGRLQPASESERKLLEALGQMPAGTEQKVGSLSVVADRPYHAASGRVCRRVTIASAAPQAESGTRLACSDGKSWFFVPDVFIAPAQEP
jgi:hypothetical protein